MGEKRLKRIQEFLKDEQLDNFTKLSKFLFEYSNYPTDKNFFENKTSEYASSVVYLFSLFSRGKVCKLKSFYTPMWTQTTTNFEGFEEGVLMGGNSDNLPVFDCNTVEDLSKINQYLRDTHERLLKNPGENAQRTIKPIEKIQEAAEGVKETEGKLFYELDWRFIEEMAKRMQNNKGSKYPRFNWLKKIDIEELKQAINRHHVEVMKGNYKDGDEELGHIVSYACNSMMLYAQLSKNND